MKFFLQKENQPEADLFQNKMLINKLSYFVDIFKKESHGQKETGGILKP